MPFGWNVLFCDKSNFVNVFYTPSPEQTSQERGSLFNPQKKMVVLFKKAKKHALSSLNMTHYFFLRGGLRIAFWEVCSIIWVIKLNFNPWICVFPGSDLCNGSHFRRFRQGDSQDHPWSRFHWSWCQVCFSLSYSPLTYYIICQFTAAIVC